jgi:hypothetical protein
MLLKERTETVQTSGLGEGNNFTIAASAKAFEVLSSNLYQNKILAVIREITCNAADAHSMVGKDLSSIKVNLPTFNMPSFSVRDYGPGLSHDDVMSLYTTYFRSTKDNNASAIGGFGLGSKSPFAVADQFTVTSWHGGTKSVYVCYKQGGMPRVNHITSEPSIEPSGLLVTVVVKAQDRNEWTRNATNFFRFWPKLPKITGLDASFQTIWQTDEVLHKSSDTLNDLPRWAIFQGSQPATVFMGLVSYSFNFDNLTKLPSEVSTLLRGTSLFLNMPVSSLQISPSREFLSYDPDTVALLETTCIRIAKGIINEAIKDLDKLPTLYDARKFIWATHNSYNSVSRAIQGLAERGVIKWRGQTIPRHAVVALHKVFAQPDGTYVGFFLAHTKRSHLKNFNTEHFDANTNWVSDASNTHSPHIVWTDKPISAKTYSTLRHNYYTLAGLSEGDYCKIILISGPPYDKLCEETAKLGFPPIDNYDDLEEPPKAIPGSNPNRRPQTSGYIIKTSGGGGYVVERTTSSLDLTGGGLYLQFLDGEPDLSYSIHTLNVLKNNSALAGPNFTDTKIIGISKHRLTPKLLATLAANKWQEFNPTWLTNHISQDTFTQFAAQNVVSHWLYKWDKLDPGFVRSVQVTLPAEVASFLLSIRPYVPTGSTWPYGDGNPSPFDGVFAIPVQEKANKSAKLELAKVAAKWQAVLTAHPMLKYGEHQRFAPQDFLDYVTR